MTYDFDKTEADYKELIGNISAGSKFEVDAASGIVTWKNEGATLNKSFHVTVVATVTFANLSEVECSHPRHHHGDEIRRSPVARYRFGGTGITEQTALRRGWHPRSCF
ncbi:MAG: hypothetical protein ACLSH3_16000 [Alistipes finegoldii]